MTSLREAVDYEAALEAFLDLDGRDPMVTTPKLIRAIVDAALAPLLSILDASEEVSWCEVHHDRVVVEGEECWSAHILEALTPCRIVSVRLFPSSLLAGLGET